MAGLVFTTDRLKNLLISAFCQAKGRLIIAGEGLACLSELKTAEVQVKGRPASSVWESAEQQITKLVVSATVVVKTLLISKIFSIRSFGILNLKQDAIQTWVL